LPVFVSIILTGSAAKAATIAAANTPIAISIVLMIFFPVRECGRNASSARSKLPETHRYESGSIQPDQWEASLLALENQFVRSIVRTCG
jgi:hypothetical protein